MFLLKKFLGEKYEYVNKIIESYNNVQNGYINLEACCSYPFQSVLDAQKFIATDGRSSELPKMLLGTGKDD